MQQKMSTIKVRKLDLIKYKYGRITKVIYQRRTRLRWNHYEYYL